jgi:hypothetical protein
LWILLLLGLISSVQEDTNDDDDCGKYRSNSERDRESRAERLFSCVPASCFLFFLRTYNTTHISLVVLYFIRENRECDFLLLHIYIYALCCSIENSECSHDIYKVSERDACDRAFRVLFVWFPRLSTKRKYFEYVSIYELYFLNGSSILK